MRVLIGSATGPRMLRCRGMCDVSTLPPRGAKCAGSTMTASSFPGSDSLAKERYMPCPKCGDDCTCTPDARVVSATVRSTMKPKFEIEPEASRDSDRP